MSDTPLKRGSIAGIEDGDLLTVDQAALVLDCHHHKVRRGIDSSLIRASRIGNGRWIILGRTIKELVGVAAE